MTKTSSRQTGSKVPQDAGDLASSWKIEWDGPRAGTYRATLPGTGTLRVDECEDGEFSWSVEQCSGIRGCGSELSEREAKKSAVLALAHACVGLQPERPLAAAALLRNWAETNEKWRAELINKIEQRHLDRGLDAFVDEQQPSILNCDIFDKPGSVDAEPAATQPLSNPDRRDSIAFQEFGSWSRPAPADLAGLVRAWWDLT